MAGFALAMGVVGEALFVTLSARRSGVLRAPVPETLPDMPADLPGVWRFYWPLASSSVVIWGGRSLLVAIVARAADGGLWFYPGRSGGGVRTGTKVGSGWASMAVVL